MKQILPFIPCHLIIALLSVSPWCHADLIEQGPKDSAPSGLWVGVARGDITPAVGIAHMVWGSANHVVAEDVDSAGMVVTAIVFANADQKFAMVSLDYIGADAPFIDAAIIRASVHTGIAPERILINATHTHSVPSIASNKGPRKVENRKALTQEIERYYAQMGDKIVGAIRQADSLLQPAHMHGGRGIGTININRRFRARDGEPPVVGLNPDGYVDRELVVFRVDDGQGNPLAILVNFQMHGTVLGSENRTISPDYIGGLRETVEDAFPGAYCLFFQGAAGDQAPVEGYSGDLAVAHRLGRILGHQVAAVAEQIETVDRQPTFEGYVESTAYQAKQYWRVKGPREASLGHISTVIDAPHRVYSDHEIEVLRVYAAQAELRLAATLESGDSSKINQANARLRRFTDLLKRFTAPPVTTPFKVEIQALRIGDLAVVAMPGEPFARIGADIKQQSPFAYTMFLGYTDGPADGGYIPTSEEFQRGGYEVESTAYGPGADQAIIEAGLDLLDRLK